MSTDSLVSALVLLVGVVFLVGRKSAARKTVEQHEALYGRPWSERMFEMWFAVAGVFFIAFALLSFLGVIQERHAPLR